MTTRKAGFCARIAVSILALWITACASGNAQTGNMPGDGSGPFTAAERSLTVEGKERWFIPHVPHGLQSQAPLVILLHGGTRNMHRALSNPLGRSWQRLASQHGFLLIAPNGTNARTGSPDGRRQNWNDYRDPSGTGADRIDDVAFILALIGWASQSHDIDLSRVYVTGASNGGMMTYRLLQDAPGAFAAGVAFIANVPDATPAMQDNGKPVPIMIVNGTDDPLMKWDGGIVGARGQKDSVMSALATRDWWIENNRASTVPSRTYWLPDTAPADACRLSVSEYSALAGGAPVHFVTMEGGGHAPPSTAYKVRQRRLELRLIGPKCRDVDGAGLAWAFFTDQ